MQRPRFRVPEAANSNTSAILVEDTCFLATVPEPASATWMMETDFAEALLCCVRAGQGLLRIDWDSLRISANAVASLHCEADEARVCVLLDFYVYKVETMWL